MEESNRVQRLARVTAALAGTLGGLLVALLYLWASGRVESGEVGLALGDRRVRALALQHLIEEGSGIWDSHPDAEVARVLQPGQNRRYMGHRLRTNRFGLREDEYALPKPPGVVRVVLLGDSYVFGYRLHRRERLGTWLERFLFERQVEPLQPVEVLSIGLPGWNVRAEAAFLRRQLSVMDPDLVVHVVVPNDLGDLEGVRGFGAAATFTPQHRERATARVTTISSAAEWGAAVANLLPLGIDHEGRQRLAEVDHLTSQLASAVEARGGRYLLLAKWAPYLDLVREQLVPGLEERHVALVSQAFTMDRAHWVREQDRHWNALASERLAMMLFGLVMERDLLPRLELEAWDEAGRWVEEIHVRGLAEADVRATVPGDVRGELTFGAESGEAASSAARQVYAGLGRDGVAGSYVSLVLANQGEVLGLEGVRLGVPELEGGTARVWVDEFEVGAFGLTGEAQLLRIFELPEAVRDRPFVNVRIESDDWAYRWEDDGFRFMAFLLRRVGIFATPPSEGE